MNVNKVSSPVSFKAYAPSDCNVRIVRHIHRLATKDGGTNRLLDFLDDSQKAFKNEVKDARDPYWGEIAAKYTKLVEDFRKDPKKFLKILSNALRKDQISYGHPKPGKHFDEFNTNFTAEYAIRHRYNIPRLST